MEIHRMIIKITVIMGLLNLLGCTQKTDLNKIYPYVITKDYLNEETQLKTELVDTIIENELYLTIVKDLNGLIENVNSTDLKQLNITRELAKDSAIKNLDNLFKEQKIKATLFNGPNDLPFILFSDHWLSAASLYWTNLYSFASGNLKTDTLYISIPQRDAMIVFPKCNAKCLNDFKTMIKEKEIDARKLLTWDIFQLDKNGIKKIE